jgi:hypothetical protein
MEEISMDNINSQDHAEIKDPSEDLKIAKNARKILLWGSWITIFSIFLIPFFLIAPNFASWSVNASKVSMETLGIPTAFINAGSGTSGSQIPTNYRQAKPEEITKITTEVFNTSLNGSRFFLGWGSFIIFLAVQLIFLAPLNASTSKQVETLLKQKKVFEEQEELKAKKLLEASGLKAVNTSELSAADIFLKEYLSGDGKNS